MPGGDFFALPVWDAATHAEFASWMPPHRVAQMLASFRARVGGMAARLAGAPDVDWGREAHDVIHSAGTLGYARLHAAARALQDRVRARRDPSAERDAFISACAEAVDHVDANGFRVDKAP